MTADASNPFPSSVMNVSSFPAAVSTRIETTISEGAACLTALPTASCMILYMPSFWKSESDDVSTSFCHEKRHFKDECFVTDAHSESSSPMRFERLRSGGTRSEQMARSSSMHFLFPSSIDLSCGVIVSAVVNCFYTSLMGFV